MNKYILITHGKRLINSDYFDSHFQVPENFNIVTFSQPGNTIYSKTIKMIVDEINNDSDNFNLKIDDIINEKNLNIRIKKILKFEKEIIINYIQNKINENEFLLNDQLIIEEDLFGESTNQFQRFMIDNYFPINYSKINSLETMKKAILNQIDSIKNYFNFQIRIYPSTSQAPNMALDIYETDYGENEENYTGTYRGIYNFNNINYQMLEKQDINDIVQTNTVFKLKNVNDLSDNFDDEYNLFNQLTNNKINQGTLLLLSCGTYDFNDDNKVPSLIKRMSLKNQGRIKRKYFINY